ncbi:unnamed protein product [Gongylonema pulchrum]|uniref:Transmembrane protein n=1 Tax=Gongylonema pulchrum TaxID=637853 RepID=A0A183EDQ6_9BILA|nr:unnamed protein product [Gongylonema pulchrum]
MEINKTEQGISTAYSQRSESADNFSQTGRGCAGQTSADNLFLRKNVSGSLASSMHSFDYEAVEEGPWFRQQKACEYLTSLLTLLYGLLVVTFALILEIFQKFGGDDWLAEMLFYVYMYGAGIAFFSYCYIFMLYPGWFNHLQHILQQAKLIPSQKISIIGSRSLAKLGTMHLVAVNLWLWCHNVLVKESAKAMKTAVDADEHQNTVRSTLVLS